MTESSDINTADLARTVAERIRWELEMGVAGYEKRAVEQRLPDVQSAPRTDSSVTTGRSKSTAPEIPPIAKEAAHRPEPVVPGASEPPVVPQSVQSPPTAVPSVDPAAALEALHRAVGDCKRCELHRGRTHLVFGEGDPKARLVFVGEGPGREEDVEGRPFVGAAGKLLDRIIEAMGLRRNQVYICNVVKCRPPNNRTPEESETNICGQFVRRQLSVIAPEVVVALGAVAASYLLGENLPISRVRGRFHQVDNLRIMPTYHPAYLLRNPAEKRAVWSDMQTVMQALGLPMGKK